MFCLAIVLVAIFLLSGCWLAAATSADVYGRYKSKEKGYTVQNPVTKEKNEKSDKKESD